MLSMPPATATVALPASSRSCASITAFMPEPHILLMVTAPVETGSPAARAACRAGAWPSPAESTQPKRTSSTASGGIAGAIDCGANGGGAELGRSEILEIALKGTDGRTGETNDDDGILSSHFRSSDLLCQRGAMRNAPSSRMVSPLSMVFSQMCLTSAANSAGLAQARRKGNALAQRLLHLLRKTGHHRRLKNSRRNGDDANARPRQFASDGQRERNHSALGCSVGRLANLAVVCGDGGGIDNDAALAVRARKLFGNGRSGQTNHVEGPNQIDAHGLCEGIEAMRPIAADHFF